MLERFSTRCVAIDHRGRYWRSLVADTFPGMSVRAGERIRADLCRTRVGQVALTVARSERARVERCGSADAERHLILHVPRRGRMLLSQNGREAVGAPGRIVVADGSLPYAIDISDGNDCLVLDVPAAALAPEIDAGDWRAASLAGEGVVAALLQAMVDNLWAAAAEMPVPAGLDAPLIELLRLLCEAQGAPPPAAAGHDCVRYAERNLDNPTLDTGMIAAACGLSTRGVQKAFLREVAVTPMAFVAERRLVRAARLLQDRGGRTVTQIAYDVGFQDSAFFSRAFRRRFGVAPSRWTGALVTAR